MPRHDPLTPRRSFSRRTVWPGAGHDPRLRVLKDALRKAEEAIEAAVRVRDELLAQMVESLPKGARGRPRRGPPKPPRRKPPEAGIPVPAVPPKGPLPKQGGAEAPLEFD